MSVCGGSSIGVEKGNAIFRQVKIKAVVGR